MVRAAGSKDRARAFDVYELSLTRKEISSLGGAALARMRKLRSLDLSLNVVVDLSGLKSLKNLREIKVVGNRISDLAPVLACRTLQSLDASDNALAGGLPDLTPLRSLRVLHLRSNALSEISARKLPRSIVELDLSDNELTALGVGPWLPMLKMLSVSQNRLDAPPKLSECSNLFFLNVSRNRFTSLRGLGAMSSLSMLNAGHNRIGSVGDLPLMPKLSELHLASNEIRALAGIERFSRLDTLDLEDNELESVWEAAAALGPLPKLTDLTLTNNPLCGSGYRLTVATKLTRLEILDGKDVTAADRLTAASLGAKNGRRRKGAAAGDGLIVGTAVHESAAEKRRQEWSGGRPLMTPRTGQPAATGASISSLARDLQKTTDSLRAYRARVDSIMERCHTALSEAGGPISERLRSRPATRARVETAPRAPSKVLEIFVPGSQRPSTSYAPRRSPKKARGGGEGSAAPRPFSRGIRPKTSSGRLNRLVDALRFSRSREGKSKGEKSKGGDSRGGAVPAKPSYVTDDGAEVLSLSQLDDGEDADESSSRPRAPVPAPSKPRGKRSSGTRSKTKAKAPKRSMASLLVRSILEEPEVAAGEPQAAAASSAPAAAGERASFSTQTPRMWGGESGGSEFDKIITPRVVPGPVETRVRGSIQEYLFGSDTEVARPPSAHRRTAPTDRERVGDYASFRVARRNGSTEPAASVGGAQLLRKTGNLAAEGRGTGATPAGPSSVPRIRFDAGGDAKAPAQVRPGSRAGRVKRVGLNLGRRARPFTPR